MEQVLYKGIKCEKHPEKAANMFCLEEKCESADRIGCIKCFTLQDQIHSQHEAEFLSEIFEKIIACTSDEKEIEAKQVQQRIYETKESLKRKLDQSFQQNVKKLKILCDGHKQMIESAFVDYDQVPQSNILQLQYEPTLLQSQQNQEALLTFFKTLNQKKEKNIDIDQVIQYYSSKFEKLIQKTSQSMESILLEFNDTKFISNFENSISIQGGIQILEQQQLQKLKSIQGEQLNKYQNEYSDIRQLYVSQKYNLLLIYMANECDLKIFDLQSSQYVNNIKFESYVSTIGRINEDFVFIGCDFGILYKLDLNTFEIKLVSNLETGQRIIQANYINSKERLLILSYNQITELQYDQSLDKFERVMKYDMGDSSKFNTFINNQNHMLFDNTAENVDQKMKFFIVVAQNQQKVNFYQIGDQDIKYSHDSGEEIQSFQILTKDQLMLLGVQNTIIAYRYVYPKRQNSTIRAFRLYQIEKIFKTILPISCINAIQTQDENVLLQCGNQNGDLVLFLFSPLSDENSSHNIQQKNLVLRKNKIHDGWVQTIQYDLNNNQIISGSTVGDIIFIK